jgi:hypothetical protein
VVHEAQATRRTNSSGGFTAVMQTEAHRRVNESAAAELQAQELLRGGVFPRKLALRQGLWTAD